VGAVGDCVSSDAGGEDLLGRRACRDVRDDFDGALRGDAPAGRAIGLAGWWYNRDRQINESRESDIGVAATAASGAVSFWEFAAGVVGAVRFDSVYGDGGCCLEFYEPRRGDDFVGSSGYWNSAKHSTMAARGDFQL